MKRLVIFDLDGTLLYTIDDLANATNHALCQLGYAPHSMAVYPMMVGNGVRKLLERALPAEARTTEIMAAMYKEFVTYYNDHLWDTTRPYTGIVSLVETLHSKGIAMAVASNKYESAVKRLIPNFFGDGTFSSICGSVDGVPNKPDPSIVFRVLTEVPTAKAEVLYVGDSAVDIETARRACVESVAVTWGFRSEHELRAANPDHIIDDPAEILSLI